jgi:arginyl-tRNA synthetase
MISNLKQSISEALNSLYNIDITADEVKLELTKKEFEGDFTFVVFSLLRQSKKSPEETATTIGEYLIVNSESVSTYTVVKGFLNLSFKQNIWLEFLNDFNPQTIVPSNIIPQKVMVEYSSPNTNKPLHLGHVRNNVLGFSICQILERSGHEVIKVNLINDRGIHICKSMLAYKLFGSGETPESSGIKGDHLVGKYYVIFDKANKQEAAKLVANNDVDPEVADRQTSLMDQAREMLLKWEQKDAEVLRLWDLMNSWVYEGFDLSYKRMGVSFDHMYKESETYLLGKNMVEEGLRNEVFYKKEDNSVWIDLTNEGLDQKLVLRADGTSVYMTQDIGTAQLKYDGYKCDTSVYIVGNEQEYHFQVLKVILKRLDKSFADGLMHMSYGMVELPDGKLKTREGKVVDADNLMDEMFETAKERTMEQGKTEGMQEDELNGLYETLGLGALKYFLLKVDPTKRILFNPAESIDFQGNTATFIQYTYARCQAILRIGKSGSSAPIVDELHETELHQIRLLQQFENKLEDAAKNYSPSIIAQYLYDVSKGFNSFYNQCPILKAENENVLQLRLMLTKKTSDMLIECGKMLGIKMPAKM